MRSAFLDVGLSLNTGPLLAEPDPSRYVIEALRHAADQKCAEAGATLDTTRAPEIIVQTGIDPDTQADVLLCSARFAVEVPEAVEVAGAV